MCLSTIAEVRVQRGSTWITVALVAGNFIAQRLSAASDHAADYGKATTTARAVAAQVRDGADADDLHALQQVLPSDRVVVKAGGRSFFAGPSMAGLPVELTVSVPVPGGTIELRDHHTPGSDGVAQVTLIVGFIAVMIIAEAWLAATVLVRTVRRPVGRAIEAAGRLADGDFSARMGASGPQEFARRGRAVDAMAAQLQRSDAEQKRFLADLVHEIATLVSAISGFALALSGGSARTPRASGSHRHHGPGVRPAAAAAARHAAADPARHHRQRPHRAGRPARTVHRDGVAVPHCGARRRHYCHRARCPHRRHCRLPPGRHCCRQTSCRTRSSTHRRAGRSRSGRAAVRRPPSSPCGTQVPASLPSTWRGSSTGSTGPMTPGTGRPAGRDWALRSLGARPGCSAAASKSTASPALAASSGSSCL